MILGQSAATAAIQAIESGKSVQKIDFETLQKRLLEDKQVLEFVGRPRHSPRQKTQATIDPKSLEGVVVDDTRATFTGTWLSSQSVFPFVNVMIAPYSVFV